MIYFVSGTRRSGTSMMMAAMRAGGLDVVWSEKREEMKNGGRKPEKSVSLNLSGSIGGEIANAIRDGLQNLVVQMPAQKRMRRVPVRDQKGAIKYVGEYPADEIVQ